MRFWINKESVFNFIYNIKIELFLKYSFIMGGAVGCCCGDDRGEGPKDKQMKRDNQ